VVPGRVGPEATPDDRVAAAALDQQPVAARLEIDGEPVDHEGLHRAAGVVRQDQPRETRGDVHAVDHDEWRARVARLARPVDRDRLHDGGERGGGLDRLDAGADRELDEVVVRIEVGIRVENGLTQRSCFRRRSSS
jgi:hypothetical protein